MVADPLLARPSRRHFLASLALLAAPGIALADARNLTPPQMLGPFYPLQPDLAAGNDLVTVNGKKAAKGKLLLLSGRVVDPRQVPQPGILVEIWQTNAHGRYHHPQDNSPLPLDPGFRGYGRDRTDRDGTYRFTTIAPVAYPGRTPHIHFRLSRDDRELLVTQMYLPDEPRNQRDGLFNAVRDPAARKQLIGVPVPDNPQALHFDLVIDSGN